MINRLTGFNLAYIQLIFNVPLCIFAFFCVDKKFSVFTVIYSLIYSLSYLVFDNMDFLTRFEYRALGEDTIYPVLVAGVVSGLRMASCLRKAVRQAVWISCLDI